MMQQQTKERVRRGFRSVIRHKPLRDLFNRFANGGSWSRRARLHGALARSLDVPMPGWRDTEWTVRFADRSFRVPLRRDDLYLDWAAALTFLGHDTDEKQSYAALLTSPAKPALFLDVGGNYGTHSLLMMAHGVQAWYFEPNRTCHGYFEAASARNGFTPTIQPVALGSAAGSITLSYPAKETWLGSTNAAVAGSLAGLDMVTQEVPMRTLDSYLPELPAGAVVMKIDAEGSEMAILEGARALLAERRPIVLLESHRDLGERQALWAFFDAARYDLTRHVWPQPALSAAAFAQVEHHNFLAVPRA